MEKLHHQQRNTDEKSAIEKTQMSLQKKHVDFGALGF